MFARKDKDKRSYAGCLKMDIFGETIQMNVAGQSTYNTLIGCACTLMIMFLVMTYAALNLIQVINFDNTAYS